MSAVAALVAALVLAGLAVLQLTAACGAPVGRLLWGGRSAVLPVRLRVASALSILLYAVFAAVLLSGGGVLGGGGSGFVRVASWVLVAYFTLGVVMNAISRSRIERAVMVPVCVVLAAASLIVALSGG